jgi:hypothetical protein
MEADMKRKALIMSMAMLTGMPGWALAKGDGAAPKTGESRTSLDAEADVFAEPVKTSARSVIGVTGIMAKVKSILEPGGQEVMGWGVGAARPVGGWRMELFSSDAYERDITARQLHLSHDDPRVDAAKPVGLAFRLKF